MSCPAKQNGEVPRKGRVSIEFHDKQGKPVYYCMGYVDKMNDELIGTCKACRQNVRYAQEDLEKKLRLGIEPQRNEMCLMYTPDFPWEEEPARIRERRYHALMSNNMYI